MFFTTGNGTNSIIFVRKLFFSWLKNEPGWDQFDLVLRIECRHINMSLMKFLEQELPEIRKLWENTISLEENLNQFSVCWIIDGYDEKSNDFDHFLDTVK